MDVEVVGAARTKMEENWYLVVSIYIASLDVVLRGCGGRWRLDQKKYRIPRKNDGATIFSKRIVSPTILQHNSFCEFVSFLPLISENYKPAARRAFAYSK